MKPMIFACALLLAAQSVPGPAQAPQAAPSEAQVDRFVAVLMKLDADSPPTPVDEVEVQRLAALNEGKESAIRAVLQAQLACSDKATKAGTDRVMRTVARNLGRDKVAKLIAFYEGPDYAKLSALAARGNTAAGPKPEDQAELERLTSLYPLQAFEAEIGRAPELFAADSAFMADASNCAAREIEALRNAGLKAN